MQLSGCACSGVGRAMTVVAARSIREAIASFMVMGNGGKGRECEGTDVVTGLSVSDWSGGYLERRGGCGGPTRRVRGNFIYTHNMITWWWAYLSQSPSVDNLLPDGKPSPLTLSIVGYSWGSRRSGVQAILCISTKKWVSRRYAPSLQTFSFSEFASMVSKWNQQVGHFVACVRDRLRGRLVPRVKSGAGRLVSLFRLLFASFPRLPVDE